MAPKKATATKKYASSTGGLFIVAVCDKRNHKVIAKYIVRADSGEDAIKVFTYYNVATLRSGDEGFDTNRVRFMAQPLELVKVRVNVGDVSWAELTEI